MTSTTPANLSGETALPATIGVSWERRRRRARPGSSPA